MAAITMGRPVLAKYDFRSKQQFIYRTNKLREIAGGSALITDAYDGFLNVLIEAGWKINKHYILQDYADRCYVNKEEETFKPDLETFAGEVIYVGGGNLYMLWRDEETALQANRALSEYLRKNTYDLSPVCGLAEYTGAYDDDIERVNLNFNQMKGSVPPISFTSVLPFTMMDRKTGLPIAHIQDHDQLSDESYLKLSKFSELPSGINLLDDIVTERGRESLLAVIYIDGNNMGARVRSTMRPGNQPIKDYGKAVKAIRHLSNSVQRTFVSMPRKAIEDALNQKKSKYRFVIAGGDEMTLICNAREALTAIKAYFDELDRCNSGEGPYYTACAGICVFHSHYPFATAYAIAEECCENAKKKNRELGGDNCLVDFQHCFGGNIGSLEDMRENDKAEYFMRPYLIKSYGKQSGKMDMGRLAEFLTEGRKLSGINRGNIKSLSQLLMTDPERYETEVSRLSVQFPQVQMTELDRKYLHDIAQFYDIWFGREDECNV